MGTKAEAGTVTHWSPELAAGEMYDTKYDMWSMGVVFYELCCLDLPFTPEPDSNTMQLITGKMKNCRYTLRSFLNTFLVIRHKFPHL